MATADIRYVKDKNNVVFFPVTHENGVVDDNGSTIGSKISYIHNNYEKTSDLTNDLRLQFNAGSSELKLLLGSTTLSTINTDNFSVGGVLSSASYNNGNLVLNFTSGDSVTIDLVSVLTSILSDYQAEVEALRNLHTSLSEEDYETLQNKDPNVYYYTYEDE